MSGASTPDDASTITVLDGATCNASATGCGDEAGVMSFGPPRGVCPDCGNWFVGVVLNPATDTVYATDTSSTDSSSPTPDGKNCEPRRAREGIAGRLKNPARSTCPAHRHFGQSHFPDPRTRRYARAHDLERPNGRQPSQLLLDTAGSHVRMVAEVLCGMTESCRASLGRG